ncbi:MAG: fatty acid desaturase [Gammaproteobacteria bacterium]|nr:fatty acid desaturase [Gammaproteobacteria bacterium]
MEEQFETRPLLGQEDLRTLINRRTTPSLVRFILHLGAFVIVGICVVRNADRWWLAFLLSVALAWIWSGLFAPFHECTHRTAFRSPRGNSIGAWLTGVPFGMAPAMYRIFHYEHHRFTQDLDKDPELTGDPRYASWPPNPRIWLVAMNGYGLLLLKLRPLIGFATKPQSQWETFARWAPRIDDPARLVFECRVVLAFWILFLLAALFLLPGGGWLVFAAWLSHVFQALWLAAEHTGLPHEGSILARTRTVTTTPFVRFWLWNMNYHAEHHAWPSIPWHQLPATHRLVSQQLESFVTGGYIALHRSVLAGRTLPRGDP